MNLFRFGSFGLNSGRRSSWKIECDALSDDDLAALARVAARGLPSFGSVEGVPTGGLRFAAALREYVVSDSTRLLIADDVLTTGGSMGRQRVNRTATGVVIFARGACPDWVCPLFQLGPTFADDPVDNGADAEVLA